MQRSGRSVLLAPLALVVLVAPGPLATVAHSQIVERAPVSAPISDLRFEVSLGANEAFGQQIGMRATFRVNGREPVILSLPAWTPGAYQIANYARNVSEFGAAQGVQAIRWDKLDADSWRIYPEAGGVVELRYLVRADTLDSAGSWTREDFGFFNGTNVFLMVEGRLDTPARVVVRTEGAWRVATSMSPADSANSFRSSDFHDLVDHPFFVGHFDLDSAEVGGRWMRLATYPARSVEGPRRAALWDALKRSVPPLVEVFGEVPWSTVYGASGGRPGLPGDERARALVERVGDRRHGVSRRPVRAEHPRCTSSCTPGT